MKKLISCGVVMSIVALIIFFAVHQNLIHDNTTNTTIKTFAIFALFVAFITVGFAIDPSINIGNTITLTLSTAAIAVFIAAISTTEIVINNFTVVITIKNFSTTIVVAFITTIIIIGIIIAALEYAITNNILKGHMLISLTAEFIAVAMPIFLTLY